MEPQHEDARQPGATTAEAGAAAPGIDVTDAVGAGEPVDATVLAERLIAAEAEVARLKDEYLRALAETENVRRRAQRDRQEAGQYAISGFARGLLPVADNLRRAIGSVDAEARARDTALDALTSGVEMTEKDLLTVLERHGVKRIEADGQPFDPHLHEALFELPNESVPHGTVVQVLEDGYTLHERTLRPARVGIARGGPKPGAQPATDASVAADAASNSPESAEGPSPIAEDDGVIEFRQRQPDAAYRKPGDSRPGTPGSRVDETH